MPKITNPFYASFIIQKDEKENHSTKVRSMEFVAPELLTQWLESLPGQKKPRKCSVEQARSFLICLYYSGCRESEAVELEAGGMTKVKEIVKGKPIYFYKMSIPALKGGVNEPIYLAINEHTKELYEYSNSLYPGSKVFYSFYHAGTNNVKWNSTKETIIRTHNQDGSVTTTKEPLTETIRKRYNRKGGKAWYYINLWTGRTPHYFRHHRFSLMKAHGWSDDEIKRAKRAKSTRSVEPYIHINPQYLGNLNKMKNE